MTRTPSLLTGLWRPLRNRGDRGALPGPQQPATARLWPYAEQLSGSAFTAPRTKTAAVALPDRRPPIIARSSDIVAARCSKRRPATRRCANRLRGDPPSGHSRDEDFVDGWRRCFARRPRTRGARGSQSTCDAQHGRRVLHADGELLIYPATGHDRAPDRARAMELAPGRSACAARMENSRRMLEAEVAGLRFG